jgi:hypothetical protein
MKKMSKCMLLVLCILASVSAVASAQDAATPVKLIVEPPTLICLGFEWQYEGDENGNVSATVEYRKRGSADWQRALDLCRTSYKSTLAPDGSKLAEARIVQALAGSILDLTPGTTYQVRLTMSDPDAPGRKAVENLELTTRAEPKPYAKGEVRHVYPPGYKGEKLEPTYKSLMHAVNGYHTWCDEYQTVHDDAAKPGTVIKMHAGTYKIDRFNYREPTQLWLTGTYTFVADGTRDKPISIVAAGDGEVIIDGDGCQNLFNIMAADYLHFEGLTIRNTFIAFHCGFQGVIGSRGLTVKNCRIENISYGVLAQDGRSDEFYIADNTFIGMNPGDRFNPQSGGAWGRTQAGYAVNLSGSGHVVCYNYAANFWDGLNVFTGALRDPGSGQTARAIDFYNNDLFNSTDNFIEADGGLMNIRVLRNRCFNCMAKPLSVQPVYAGPVYWVRNVVFNAPSAFKLASGKNVLAFHNTINGHQQMDFTRDEVFLNNVFCGPAKSPDQRKKRPALNVNDIANTLRDYNAYRVKGQVDWMFTAGARGRQKKEYATLEAFAQATGLEKHGITFESYDIFAGAEEATYGDSNEDPLVEPESVDLRPAANSVLIDAGTVIPNINEDYAGKAPDIGAYEFGKPLPHYGPREKKQPDKDTE